jgi:hypothetical protein
VQKKLDLMMEIEHLKALKKQKAQELSKHDQRKKGAQVILDQIQEWIVQRIKNKISKTRKDWNFFQILKKCIRESKMLWELNKKE